MFKPSYTRGDYSIVRRRAEEHRVDNMRATAKKDFILKSRAEWEISTDEQRRKKTEREEFARLAGAHEAALNERRKRLAELLHRERDGFEREMEMVTSSILDRRTQMIERAKTLREEREADRKRLVQEKLKQQFEAACPQLHEVQSALREKDCASAQVAQMKVRETVREAEAEADREFAEVWEADRLRKEARHEQDIKRKKELEMEDLRVRNLQMQELARQREIAKEVTRREHALLIELWDAEKEVDQRKAKELAEYKHKAARTFARFNRDRIEAKKREIEREREEDLLLVNRVIEEAKALDAEDARKRAAHIAEVREYREQLARQMEKERISEAHLDRMRIDEQERAWAKRQADWDKEEEARKKLREEVLRARADQIRERLEAARVEKEEGKKRRMQIIEEQQRLKALDEAEEAERLKQKMYIKEYLEWQIEERENERLLEKEDEEFERQAAKRAEERFQTRIMDTVSGVESYPTYFPKRGIPFF